MQKVEFIKDGSTCKVVSFNKKKQELKVQNLDTKEFSLVAFAHIPKKIKKLLNPL